MNARMYVDTCVVSFTHGIVPVYTSEFQIIILNLKECLPLFMGEKKLFLDCRLPLQFPVIINMKNMIKK